MPKIPVATKSKGPTRGLNIPSQNVRSGGPVPSGDTGLDKALGGIGKMFDQIVANQRAQDDLNTINKFKIDATIGLDNILNDEGQKKYEDAQGAEGRYVESARILRNRITANLPEYLKPEAMFEYDLNMEAGRQKIIKHENEQRKAANENNLVNIKARNKNLANEDPLNWQAVADSWTQTLNEYRQAGAFAQSQIDILDREGKDEIVATAVKSMIIDAKDNSDPVRAYSAIELNLSDKVNAFKDYLSEETREDLLALTKQSREDWQDTQKLTAERLQKDVEEKNLKALNDEKNFIAEKIIELVGNEETNAADWMRVRNEVTSPDMAQLSKKDNATDRLQLIQFVDNKIKGLKVEGDPIAYGDMLEKISDRNEILNVSIYDINDLYISEKITEKQWTQLRNIFNSNKQDLPLDYTEAKKSMKDLKNKGIFAYASDDPEIQSILKKDVEDRTPDDLVKLASENQRIYIDRIDAFDNGVQGDPKADKLKLRDDIVLPIEKEQAKGLFGRFVETVLSPFKGSGVQNKTNESIPKKLDSATAKTILLEAGGDKEKARQIAKERGYEF